MFKILLLIVALLSANCAVNARTISLHVGVADELPGYRSSHFDQKTSIAFRLQTYSSQDSFIQEYFSFTHYWTPFVDKEVQVNNSTLHIQAGDSFTNVGTIGCRLQPTIHERMSFGIMAGISTYLMINQECKSSNPWYSHDRDYVVFPALELGAEIGFRLSAGHILAFGYTWHGLGDFADGLYSRELFAIGVHWMI
jgi:hypothetical protein